MNAHKIQGLTTIETLLRLLPVPLPVWDVSTSRHRVVWCQRCGRPVNPCCYMYRHRRGPCVETAALMCWPCKDLFECWLEHEYRKVRP